MSKSICLLTIALFANFHIVKAQTESRFSGNFSNVSFSVFAKALESQTDYHVYFNPADCDSIKVDLKCNEILVSEVFTEIFKGTEFNFAIDQQRNVFIVKGVKIETSFYDGFFSKAIKTTDRENAMNEVNSEEKFSKERIIEVGSRVDRLSGRNALLSGHIREKSSGEPVVGATVAIEKLNKGVITDQFGYFSFSLPSAQYDLVVRGVGFKEMRQRFFLYSDGNLNIEMDEDITLLKEIVVESGKDFNVSGMQMGFEKLDMKALKKVSTVLGEVDVLKVLLTLPGVQSVGEASSGLNVRGGSTNQNLVLYNDAVIYNPTHLFGFFTAFNPDAIKSVEIMKSGIPAEKGGRLSSVIDIRSHEGNSKKFIGSGGIGFLTGKLTLEGPIIKDKTSFLIGARSMYSNWLLQKVSNETIQNSRASFYDVNMSVSHTINEKNSIYISYYKSHDEFKFIDDTVYSYSNSVGSIKWRHLFRNKLQGVFTLAHSSYRYSVEGKDKPIDAFLLDHHIRQGEVKAEFTYIPFTNHTFTFGTNSTYYEVLPGRILPLGKESLIIPDKLHKERAIENAIYFGDSFEVNSKITVYGGLRYSLFNSLGPGYVRQYAKGLPKTSDNVIDTIYYPTGKTIAFYHGPELRVSLKYVINQNLSVKASYNRMRQYLQMLSNTTSVAPTDVWKLSDAHIKPQIGDQFSVGVYKNLKNALFETSLEGYFKTMENFLDYKDGADLILNHEIESDVIMARGVAFGAELMIKKTAGKLSGWISYAYSRSFLQTRSNFASEIINKGEYYPSNYDKPHAINFIGNYKFTHRIGFSINSTYSTGRPITLPLAKYKNEDATRLLYSERNKYRVDDYFRIDISLNIEGNHRIKKLAHSSWTFGVYNLTGRKNVYSVFFRSEESLIRGYKMSVFGAAIPSVTYNFRF